MANEAYYPYYRRQYFTHEARMRRKQLHISVAKLRQKVPYYRFLKFTMYLWTLFYIPLSIFNWVWPGNVLGNDYVFILQLAMIGLFFGSVYLFCWVQKYIPATTHVQIGKSHIFTARNFKPGQFIRQIKLARTDEIDSVKVDTPFEFILCGGTDNLPNSVGGAKGPVIIGKATTIGQKGKLQAGLLDGPLYKMNCKGKAYIGGDLDNWRQIDWVKEAREALPHATITDYTEFIVGADRNDPVTHDEIGEPPTLERELFDAKQRIIQLQTELDDYTMKDKFRKSAARGFSRSDSNRD